MNKETWVIIAIYVAVILGLAFISESVKAEEQPQQLSMDTFAKSVAFGMTCAYNYKLIGEDDNYKSFISDSFTIFNHAASIYNTYELKKRVREYGAEFMQDAKDINDPVVVAALCDRVEEMRQ